MHNSRQNWNGFFKARSFTVVRIRPAQRVFGSEMLHERGVDVSYESVRYWWHLFGSKFASEIKKRRAGGMQSSNWKWHLDEVFIKINGERHYLWRAVDHEGEVLESYVTKIEIRRQR